MKVAIVHYDMRPSGVQSVIEMQSSALAAANIDHVVLTGTPYEGNCSIPCSVIEALDWLNPVTINGQELAESMRGATIKQFGCLPDIWHFHNPALGLNSIFPDMLSDIVKHKSRVVIHMHDFVENNRPSYYERLYGKEKIYPLAPQIAYCTINSMDIETLMNIGVPSEQLCLLSNPVKSPLAEVQPNEESEEDQEANALQPSEPVVVLYPVRGVRRKNLGEFCLLAAVAPIDALFAVTRKPTKPEWLRTHNFWENASLELRLPVHFGVVGRLNATPNTDSSYASWLMYADVICTTSISEGYGLAFVESALMKKPLIGRDLVNITEDFKDKGMSFESTYEALLVPLDWVDLIELKLKLTTNLQSHFKLYKNKLPIDHIEKCWKYLTRFEGYLDFGNLPEDIQLSVIKKAKKFGGDKLQIWRNNEVVPLIPWLKIALQNTQDVSESSFQAARLNFSLGEYGNRLLFLYNSLTQKEVRSPKWIDKQKVLAQFLRPEKFQFLSA